MWKDIDKFLLPDPERMSAGAQSALTLSETLSSIANYLIYISQYEPELKEKMSIIKTELEISEKSLEKTFLEDLAEKFDDIPDTHKKNTSLQTGWVRNHYKAKYQKSEDEIRKMKRAVIHAARKYDDIYRKIKTARIILDVGRSVLSSLKEELKNLPIS